MPITSKTKSVYGHWPYKVKDEAGAARTITEADFGCIITNSGGALAATLPAPIAAFTGCWVKFYTIADGGVTIDATGGNNLIVHNDATATSTVNSTASHQIGDALQATCTGDKWFITCFPPDEGITRTVT